MRFVIKLHKKGGWFVIDTANEDTQVRGPFKSKVAAEFAADRLNGKDSEWWPDEELLKAAREKYGDD